MTGLHVFPNGPMADSPSLDALFVRAASRAGNRLALVGDACTEGMNPTALIGGLRDNVELPNDNASVTRQRLTWSELESRVRTLAGGFTALGIRPGDRVAVCLENCIEHVVTLLALWRIDATAVLVHSSTPAKKLAHMLDDAHAACVVLHARHLDALPHSALATRRAVVVGKPSQRAVRTRDIGFNEATASQHTSHEPTRIGRGGAVAVLLYTSGSTGDPKGVMHGHSGLVHITHAIADYLQAHEDDVITQVLPLSFGYGLTQLLLSLFTGCTLVLERSFAFPQVVAARMALERSTLLAVVPTMASILVGTDTSSHDLSALRLITNAGAALPPALSRELRRAFPRVGIVAMYGATECIRASALPPEELDQRPLSVGRGLRGQEHWLVDAQGVRLPRGSTGELVVAGPHVMLGYWGKPSETEQKICAGPRPGERTLRTGDIFREDSDGYLTFVARTDDIIKTRGEKVSPREVEDALYTHHGVKTVCVVGVPHPLLGEAVCAWVVPKEGTELHARALMRHCSGLLEDFAVPRDVVVVDTLPTLPNGKIDTPALRAESHKRMNAAAIPRRSPPMSTHTALSKPTFHSDVLRIDAENVANALAAQLRDVTVRVLKRRGIVVGLSGGIDSSATAALAVRALGPQRVVGLLMPEQESGPDTLELSRSVAEALGIKAIHEDITGILESAGAYARRDKAIRSLVPEFGPGWKAKVVLPDVLDSDSLRVASLVVQSPTGEQRKVRMTAEAHLTVVAATNFKQRTRKMVEYFYADQLHMCVAGTPNRLEYDQGFFVKGGDGLADVKPIAHLYKQQVYALARALGVPAAVLARRPTTDTYSLPQGQDEFYFSLPYETMDLILWARNNNIPVDNVAGELRLTPVQVERVYRDIDQKRRTTRTLHLSALLLEGTPASLAPIRNETASDAS